jgi:hypothetical protein
MLQRETGQSLEIRTLVRSVERFIPSLFKNVCNLPDNEMSKWVNSGIIDACYFLTHAD